MRILLIVNASASSVTARARVVIHKALAADHEVILAGTRRRGHATRLAQGAAADGVELVAVLGGDGTLNEAANGLAGSATALGVLPGGSTNVFARTIGMTNDPIEATGELLDALARGAIRSVALGSVNGRYFLFHVGLGYDAAVVAQVERRATLKRYAGPALFLTAAVSTWFRHYDRSRPRLALVATTSTGQAHEVRDVRFCIALKTSPYTFLGTRPIDVAPGTGLETGLTLLSFRTLNLATLGSAVASAWRGGGRSRWKPGGQRISLISDVVSVTVSGFGPFPYQVDGDHLGDTESLDIRCVPDVLRLVVP